MQVSASVCSVSRLVVRLSDAVGGFGFVSGFILAVALTTTTTTTAAAAAAAAAATVTTTTTTDFISRAPFHVKHAQLGRTSTNTKI